MHDATRMRLDGFEGRVALLGVPTPHDVEIPLTLAPGETLVLVTDGLIESRGHTFNEGLDALLRLSPSGFEGFMRYGALPSQTKQLAPVVKEIISVAVDATPTHRYMPGLRLHLANAVAVGAGRNALLEAIDIAADAPAAPGVP